MRSQEAIPSINSAAPSRRLAVFAALLFSVAYFAISLRFKGPGYLADEVGYLLNAAALTGDRIDGASSYHFGYSLLIAPAFLVSDNPKIIWPVVQALNAAMFGASLVALYAVGERLAPEASTIRRLGALIVCALSPIPLVMAGYAFATPAFVLVYILSVLALLEAAENNGALLAHGALVGFLFWVHPVGAGVIVASLAAIVLVAIRSRTWVVPFCAAAIEITAVALYRLVLSPVLVQWMTPAGFQPQLHYESFDLANVTPYVLWEAVIRGVGQLSYIAIGTLGFAVLGFAASLYAVFKAPRPANRAACAYMTLSLLGVVGIGALMFAATPETTRPDHWMYGRYADGAVLPLLMLGLLTTGYRRWAPLCILIPAAFVALVYITPGTPDLALSRSGLWPGLNLVNLVSFWPATLPDGTTLAAAILLGGAIAALAVLLPRWAATAVILSAFGLCAYVQLAWHHRVLTIVSKPSDLPEVVRRSWPSGSCIGLDPDLPENEAWRVNLYKFHLHDYDIRRMTLDEWRAHCNGPFISSDFTDVGAGTKVATRETDSGLLLLSVFDRPITTPADIAGLYPPGSACLTSAKCFVRDVDEIVRRQHTQVGRFDGGAIRTTGTPGYLVFGPGLPFEAGRYTISLDADIAAAGKSYIDVIDGTTEIKTIAHFDLDGSTTTFEFDLSEPAKSLQVRIFVDGGATMGVRGYTLSSND